MEKHHLTPEDGDAETGFRWSLTLVAKILVRTILEGATMGLERSSQGKTQVRVNISESYSLHVV